MKKLLLIIPLIIITGCTNKEQVFKDYAKKYYENHMKMISNIDEVTITKEDVENASTEDDYDMKKIKKCDKNSKVIFYIDKETKEIKNEKIEINCWNYKTWKFVKIKQQKLNFCIADFKNLLIFLYKN